ncbi:MAG: hypothetical protein WDM89_03415 [Rhizomicrobium sp.]
MRIIKTALTVAALAAGLVAANSASAAVACNRDGDCWHVRNAYAYHPDWGVTVHESGWKWGPNDHYRWREHTGRGYWRSGVWIRF